MKTNKWFLLLAVLLLVGSAWPAPAWAKEPEPPAIPGIENPAGNLTQQDLQLFVKLAFRNEITGAQAQALYERLSDEQKTIVSELVAKQAGIPLEEWNRERAKSSSGPVIEASELTLAAGEVWRQYIENAWTIGIPDGSAFAYYSDVQQYCEGDNSDPDNDWVFYFSMNYNQDPDHIRWTSLSSQVYLAFMAAYGGNLNGYAYNWSEVRLCLGTVGVAAAGGPVNVQNNLFLWHAW